MNDEIARRAVDDSEDSPIGPLAGAFPELASLTDADLEWAREQWQRGLDRQLELVSAEPLTDWDRFDAMQDDDIHLSDSPKITPTLLASETVLRRDWDEPEEDGAWTDL